MFYGVTSFKASHVDPRSAPGYTLMELLLTLFVIGALSVLIIPVLGHTLGKVEARSFVHQLEEDIAFAQKHAMATEWPIRLKVSQFGRMYTISEPAGVNRSPLKIETFPQGVSVSGDLDVLFQPHVTFAGQSNGGTVYVRHQGKTFAEVRISLLSSRTRVIWHD